VNGPLKGDRIEAPRHDQFEMDGGGLSLTVNVVQDLVKGSERKSGSHGVIGILAKRTRLN
jgi:hypothetical protein